MRIFDGYWYRVTVTRPEGESKGTIIHFDGLMPVDRKSKRSVAAPPAKHNYLTAAGFVGVFVQPLERDWYQNPTLGDAAAAICSTSDLPRPWLSYGNSMGGYGAIAAAPLLGTDFFLAGSPQASISATYFKTIEETRWHSNTTYHRHDPILNGACANAEGIVLCDPRCTLDQLHTDAILSCTRARQLVCHGSDHFGIFRVTRDIGFRPFVRDLFDAIVNPALRDRFITRSQAIFDASVAKRFFDNDVAGQWRILDEVGSVELLNKIHHTALVEHFNKAPDRDFATLLASLLPNVAHEVQRKYIERALRRAGLGDLLHLSG